MKTREELLQKYPQNIVQEHFDKGIIFDWDQEYFDIIWQYPYVCLVLLDLFKLNIVIDSIDVFIDNDEALNDSLFSYTYEGSSWNKHNLTNIELKKIILSENSDTLVLCDALFYLDYFYENNMENIYKFYFKVNF